MKGKIGAATLSLGLLLPVMALAAPHSFAAEYDEKKPVTLKGVVTKVEWANPHARFYVDVKYDKGNVDGRKVFAGSSSDGGPQQ